MLNLDIIIRGDFTINALSVKRVSYRLDQGDMMMIEHEPTPSLIRINDDSYVFERDDRPLVIKVSGSGADGRLSRLVAEAALHVLKVPEPDLSGGLDVRGRSWKIVPSDTEGGYFWSLLNSIHGLHTNTKAQKYSVYETGALGWWYDKDSPAQSEASIPLSASFAKKVSDQIALYESYESKPFEDPFTRLAAEAFQKYEPRFCHKDFFSFEECATRLVFSGEAFLLVRKESALAHNLDLHRKTYRLYSRYIRDLYGDEKIEEITARYRLTFDDTIGLTPEHIYRINIGVHDFWIRDLRALWERIDVALQEYGKQHLEAPLEDFLEAIPSSLIPGSIKRALYRKLKRKWATPKKGDFTNWVNQLNQAGAARSFDDLTMTALNELMTLFLPDDEACFRSLTGRGTYGFIRSYYSHAETGEYKPWVDQQDVLQTVILLRGQKDPDIFYEKLAHVIVKKHLARDNPDGDYRVGELIPAPLGTSGQQAWYVVTSCISTPTGFHSYTLESAVPGEPLDKIKLYRSTASNPCSLRYSESIQNDLNCINSPGYEGVGMAEKYERLFFFESSVPVWVGYMTLAERELKTKSPDREAACQSLLKATQSLEAYLTRDFKRKDLRSIVRKYDAVLNRLYRSKRSRFPSYSDITRLIRLGWSERLVESITTENETKIAQDLFDQLSTFSEQEEDPVVKFSIVCLKDEIFRHVLNYYEISFLKAREDSRFLVRDLSQFEAFFQKADGEDKQAILEQWVERLSDIAMEDGEHPSLKKQQNIVLTGHSLGGACAASHIIYYFLNQDRIPCSGCTCVAMLYDDPCTNDIDNERFKQWGLSHSELMRRLECGFFIQRSHETGDIVPTGGEVHLGATYSLEEDRQLKSWLGYHYRLYERKEDAADLAVLWSRVTHETQFSTGKEGVDYLSTPFRSDELGKFDQRGKIKSVYDRQARSFVRVKCEEEVEAKVWEALSAKWKLGSNACIYDSESIRSDPWFTWLWAKYFHGESEDRISQYTDDRGNFVVTDQGVVSEKLMLTH